MELRLWCHIVALCGELRKQEGMLQRQPSFLSTGRGNVCTARGTNENVALLLGTRRSRDHRQPSLAMFEAGTRPASLLGHHLNPRRMPSTQNQRSRNQKYQHDHDHSPFRDSRDWVRRAGLHAERNRIANDIAGFGQPIGVGITRAAEGKGECSLLQSRGEGVKCSPFFDRRPGCITSPTKSQLARVPT